MKIAEYLERYRGKRIYILGLGVSNRPLVRILCEAGLDVTACDRAEREKIEATATELEGYGAKLRLGAGYLDGAEADVVFRTPVMLPTIPELRMFAEQGAEITSEMEMFFEICPCHTIGITGSDGKTTTTTLISEMLKADGKRVWLGGNIGTPLLPNSDEMSPDDYAVVELSSFQLMDMKRSADIAVVTNLAPNHLDHHTDMQEYVDSKKHIFSYQGKDGVLVINHDNAITAGFAPEAAGLVREFSRAAVLEKGVCFHDDTVFRDGVALLKREDILLPGLHNVENYMTAVAALEGIVSDAAIRKVAANFGGVEHRIELVRVLNGVRYYNDSIASSPSRTIAALHSFPDKLILIAGGYDKKIPFDVLGPEVCRHVRELVLCGATAELIREAVEASAAELGFGPHISMHTDFAEAVSTAAAAAKPGEAVILSPACASFDLFKNFAERGNVYKKLVKELS